MSTKKDRRRTSSAVGNILNYYEKAVVNYSKIGAAPMRDRHAIKQKYLDARSRVSEYLKETIPGSTPDINLKNVLNNASTDFDLPSPSSYSYD